MSYCRESTHIARKRYRCDAANDLLELGIRELDEADQALLLAAEAEGCAILPGQRYIKTVGVCDGRWFCCRSRPELHALCVKYDLFAEW